ncbi:hypothetical protein J4209_05460 [Candidatus Woesearchaeota archaeon]|nr:hypothetical protein [Candidatus Woesearchaeota archaeon]
MNRKLTIVIGVAIILIFIFGCGTGKRDRPGEGDYDYRTGSNGLTLNFPVGTITQAFENDPEVKMVVEVRNEGAFPQFDETGLNGRIWVGGFDPNIIDLRPETDLLDEEELEGRSQYNRQGGYSGIVISGPVYQFPPGTTYYDPTLMVTVTYEYKTIASPIVCIDPEPRSTNIRDKVCDITNYGSVSISSSQGAPVAVTRMEEDATHDAILFKIYIQNVGGGLIINENDVDKNPNSGYDWDELNKVRIADISVGNRRVTQCRPDIGEFVDLLNNEGFIFCKFSTAGLSSVYTTPLNIELEYAYANSIERRIEIFEEVEY